ncbi:MAG: tetratricopeptide repeat protein, partial [Paludibacteraceae bacterium]|nr:tetratricopeptide repeat protein [Paludibacteraceae bacterium]
MRKKLILASMLVSAQLLCAQQSKDYTQADKLFHEGKALYDQGHFKAAYERLNEYFLTLDMKDRSPRYIETEYYIACCSYELQRRDAGRKLSEFTSDNAQSTLANRIHFLSASHKYDKQLYKEAVEEFSQCDRLFLSQAESADYLFKQGYSLLQCKEVERARNVFSILLNQQSKYNVAAKYYKAYTDYLSKDYESALPVFEELQQLPEYARIVPYYIFQIYYAQKRYDEVLETGEALLKADPNNPNSKEIHRLLGECYYTKKDYANTIKYLSLYQKEAEQVVRENMYMLGNSYYQTGDYQNAIT